MEGWFDIRAERNAGLVQIMMGGFFDADRVARLHAALRDAVVQLGLPANQHVTLCDITAMKIQSQNTVTTFGSLIGSPDTRSRLLAFVAPATLVRGQAKRLVDRPGIAFFPEVDAAREWLLRAESVAA